jgi:LmbE family N-acetylglucosaminyl deacetylase
MMSQQPEYIIPRKVLVIGAHPDDIDFGTAGSVARWVQEGAHVSYCIITDGSAGSNDPATDMDELVAMRRTEQLAAAAVVGVHDVRFLAYRDGTLQPTLDLRRDLTRLIRELRPDRVVCQDPTTVFVLDSYINHPDHRAAGEAAIYAVFPSAETLPVFPELLLEGYEPHHVNEVYMNLTMQPDFYIDISSTIDKKIEALLCHASQVQSDTADWIRERNAEAGKEAGYHYAEAFRVMRLYRE